jgi:hypothetical protein
MILATYFSFEPIQLFLEKNRLLGIVQGPSFWARDGRISPEPVQIVSDCSGSERRPVTDRFLEAITMAGEVKDTVTFSKELKF